MKKILLKFMLVLRKVYSKIFEYIIIKKIKRNFSKDEINQAKLEYESFVNGTKSVTDYSKHIETYIWKSDLLKGLIDWSPSEKNLWQFFLGKEYSRDCDDFSALAYFTLGALGYNVEEYCVLTDDSLSKAHMVVIVVDGIISYICCNNRVETFAVSLEKLMKLKYKSTIFVKYRGSR